MVKLDSRRSGLVSVNKFLSDFLEILELLFIISRLDHVDNWQQL